MPPSMPSHCCIADVAGAALVPVFPRVGAGAQLLAGIVAAEHRPGREEDHRHAGAERAHDQRRRGLVAAAHQHRAVDRLAADLLLRLHRQQVAVEHGGRLHEGFRHADRRQFDRQAAGLQHAALDVVDAALEMGVAGVEVRPGVEDADHRPADPILGRIAHLHHARAMAEAAQIVGGEPARAAQLFGLFGHRFLLPLRGSTALCYEIACRAGSSNRRRMPMKIAVHSDQPREEWRPGVETRMHVSALNGATQLCIFEQWVAPGAGAPTHSHTVEEVLTVIAGEADMWIDERACRALSRTGPYCSRRSPARFSQRRVSNTAYACRAGVTDPGGDI